ncbi:MAG: aminotransferase class IV [Bacteroidota bacterium]
MLDTVYLNGEYLPKAEAALNVADLSILRGYGIFDYFRYAEGKPRFMADHIARFQRSATYMDLVVPIDGEALAEAVLQLIARNGQGAGGIRFVMTGGYAPDGYTPSAPNLMAMAYAFKPPPARQFEAGARILIHSYERQLPAAKTIDYIEGIRLLPQLKAGNYDYPLYLDRAGYLRESDRSNYMIVRDGVLITPIDEVLLGITRKHTLRLAAQLGIPTEERPIKLAEFLTADEALLTSSTKGIMPIGSADGQAIGNGQPGPITCRMMAAWRDYVK